MIEINLSLVLVMVCFWVTLWLVNRFLIRPTGRVIGERRRRIDDAHQEWSAKNEEYQAALGRTEDAVTEAAKDAARIRAEARQRAMDARQATLDEARAKADDRLIAALDSLDADADAARTDLRRRAEELASLLAGRLLGREVAG